MLKSKRKLILLSLILLVSFSFGFVALGADQKPADENVRDSLDTTAGAADISTNPDGLSSNQILGRIVGRLINYLFGVVGMIFVLILMIGAYLWMTARGNEEKVAKAKTFILNGFFGLMVVFIAWGIVFLLGNAFGGASGVVR